MAKSHSELLPLLGSHIPKTTATARKGRGLSPALPAAPAPAAEQKRPIPEPGQVGETAELQCSLRTGLKPKRAGGWGVVRSQPGPSQTPAAVPQPTPRAPGAGEGVRGSRKEQKHGGRRDGPEALSTREAALICSNSGPILSTGPPQFHCTCTQSRWPCLSPRPAGSQAAATTPPRSGHSTSVPSLAHCMAPSPSPPPRGCPGQPRPSL